MYDICHPTYYNMSQLGCNDQIKLTTAFYVYMELCEVKRYWDVEYKYCNTLQLFYLEAKKYKKANIDIFIPWPAMNNITLDIIYSIQHKLETNKFTFVFKEGDTTSVYYSVCTGIIKPITPNETIILKQKENKKFELEKEINRNIANLYERALLLNDDETEEASNKSSKNNIEKEESNIKHFYIPMELDSLTKEELCDLKILNDSGNSTVNTLKL
ncbi:PREDICTED: tRNA-splicing endonuclease subunit Sen15-like [Ceratosolen solmsi marchali]|uniref:tRNA-splicing endonuclease subunit Sen15-like n=1 Tax=Ceratosolen solmsi marchali TaxID=326594 RepID=A0AAJ6YC66_9HYME|nr:PREDICTED: tRNA-splicing endonuclease subunit Sen15-like [Ceratosolen solmsi marchali]